MSDTDRIQRLHDQACRRGEASYLDPISGLMVLTSHYLRERGFCCEAGCRHCPYGRAPAAKRPA